MCAGSDIASLEVLANGPAPGTAPAPQPAAAQVPVHSQPTMLAFMSQWQRDILWDVQLQELESWSLDRHLKPL